MEQERYNWMWSKRKEGFNSHVLLSSNPSYGDSWEEKAFAEDAAGPHGGCIWPPRSYTCSFCRREFRSAQALGGHMNVHRRDRARLKQSPSPNNNLEILQHHQNQILNPSQNTSLSMLSNPNSDHLDHAFLAPPSSKSSRVSILPTPNINDKRTLIPLFSPLPFIQENLKSNSNIPFSSWSKLDPEKCFQIQGLEKEKGSKVFESNCMAKKNQVTNDLSMNLNLVIRQSCEMAFDDNDGDLVVLGYKRRRTDETLSFCPKRVLVDRDQPESEVLDDEKSPSLTENLDLELRLGDRPK